MFDILKKTAKNSMIYGIGTLSSKLIGFVLLPLYTTHLTTSEYGILAIVDITASLLAAIVSLKINAAFFRWYWDPEFAGKQKSIFFTSLVVLAGAIFVLLIPQFFFAGSLSFLLFETSKYSYLLILMLISTALQVIIQLALYLMQLQQRSLFFSFTTVIKLATALVLTIVFIAELGRSINGIYEALIISQIVFLFISTKYIINNSALKFEFKIVGGMLKFSVPLIFAEISGILLTVADRYCLNFLATTSDVGIYSLGFKVANTIRVFVYSSVMMAVSPLIYQYIDKPGNMRFYSKILTYFAFGTMIFVLFLSLFGKELIELIAQNNSYWSASEVIPILSFAILFGILKDAALTGLNIIKRTSIIAIVVLVMSIINIGLNFLLIPDLGSKGAAYATLITRVMSFAVFYKIAQTYYRIPYELKKVMLAVIVGLIFSLSVYPLNSLSSVYLRIIVKSTLWIIFPVVLYFFNFFEEVELARIKGAWKKWRNPKDWKQNLSRIKFFN